MLLFLPNETLSGVHPRARPGALDDALGQKVVLCSPLTLFAFLGVIRQAFDNFMVEQTSDEILALLGAFGQQWGKYIESLETVKRRMDSVAARASTTRRHPPAPARTTARQLEALRREPRAGDRR